MPVTRKLAAVVFADVVGYSRLMERDEAGTHARLREIRAQLIDPSIAAHGGRIVRTTGDGLLFEFPSATAALRCAVELQREMGTRNLFVAADERIEFRIGINLGDIIVEGDDIIGDGVNVAARLETLASPGGICVASAVWEQVHEDLGVEFVDAGEQQVKNISKPVHVYRVSLGKGLDPKPAPIPAAAPKPRVSRAWRMAIGVGALAIFAAAAAVMWHTMQSGSGAADGSASLRSVLILPFSAPAGDQALTAAAAQLTNDVTRALGDSMRDVRVVPPASAIAYAGKAADARTIGREAKVRYLVEGDLRPAGTQIAVTLRLVDTLDGKQLESERKVVDRAQIGDADAMVRLLTSTTRVLLADVISRAAAGGTGTATAQDLLDRSYAVSLTDPVAKTREVYRLANEAVKLDPNLAGAWSQRAAAGVDLLLSDFSADTSKLLADADADSLRAVTINPRDAIAWVVRGNALAFAGKLDAAFAANDRAQELDPTRYYIAIQRGWLYLMSGRPDETTKLIARLRSALGPNDSSLGIQACATQVALGAYDEAVRECERIATASDNWYLYANLTAAHAMRGDAAKAAQAKDKLLKVVPGFTLARYDARHLLVVPEALAMDRAHLVAGLRKAGVPE